MTPHVVVDVGNTRIKWGRCSPDAVVESASLPPDDPAAWQEQLERWSLPSGSRWVLAGVHPARRERLADWLRQRGESVRVVKQPAELPLRTLLAEPEKAGIDRLLDAVAANRRREPDHAAVIVDAGSAVTVDCVDETGAFAGGAILPGLRLMAKSLHDYTALLPQFEPPREVPIFPATGTLAAMETGIFWAVAGGAGAMIRRLQTQGVTRLTVFLTGGDAPLLHHVFPTAVLWPAMTLDGLRWTAETLS
jgi:type III pantothenate kinase